MNKDIKRRVLSEANHIIKTQDTIRQTADRFNVSKSTVHTDLSERLKEISKSSIVSFSVMKPVVVILNQEVEPVFPFKYSFSISCMTVNILRSCESVCAGRFTFQKRLSIKAKLMVFICLIFRNESAVF